jgi:hypothetical protein
MLLTVYNVKYNRSFISDNMEKNKKFHTGEQAPKYIKKSQNGPNKR